MQRPVIHNGLMGRFASISLSLAALLAASALAQEPAASALAQEPAAKSLATRAGEILEKRCHSCHSHAARKMEGNLALDSRGSIFTGGDSGAAIVANQLDASLLIRAVRYQDEDRQMPPKQKMPAEEIALLEEWVKSGAADPWPGKKIEVPSGPWWSLKPLERPSIPKHGAVHPIDAYIQATLASKGLALSPEADRRTLIRRVAFNLTGLPPSEAEVAAFVADPDPLAYEKLVDRLLASPGYGERWARHWLDVVHYADTHGNDHDWHRPNAWPYRDYVIRSLNADKPYARFIEEQVAGDALYPNDPQATIALGFLAAGPWDHTLLVTVRDDTIDHAMGRNLDRDNMVSTTMSTFQSLTVHCARCHSHKFDPISQREYYALQAVFAGVDRAERPYDIDPAIAAQRANLLAQREAIAQRDAAALKGLDLPIHQGRIAELEKQLVDRKDDWQPLEIVEVRSESEPGTEFRKQEDGSWLVEGKRPKQDTLIVVAQTKLTRLAAFRLETLADPRLPGHGPGRYDTGNFHLTEFRLRAGPLAGKPAPGDTELVEQKFAKASADHDEAGYAITGAIDGKPETWWGIHPKYGQSHEGVFELAQSLGFEGGTRLLFRLEHQGKDGHQIGRFRLSACTDSIPAARRVPLPADIAALGPLAATSPAQRRELALRLLANERLAQLDAQLATLPIAEKMVYAVTRDFKPDGNFKPSLMPRPIHLLARGDLNKPQEPIGPGALSCQPSLPGRLTIPHLHLEAERRAALAKWLSDPKNGLTWRSIVNRTWHYHFGRGLCDTPNDFGRMGGMPRHPELLDWLAVWFRDDAGGSLKSLHRLIVLSQTYRQSSQQVAAAQKIDADNRLLARMNRNRLSGEAFRDAVLALSGRLDNSLGGPPAVLFNDRGKATFAPGDGSPPFVDYHNFDPDAPAARRRSVYRFLFRTVPDPLMDALDCPDGGAMTPVRTESSGAPQALALLNNPWLIRYCEHIAARLAAEHREPAEQVSAAYRLILLRHPQPLELEKVTGYVRRHGLANAVQLLVNTNEFLYVD